MYLKDAEGKPVQGATVNLRRDGVEGFSMSTPSDNNGKYTMYYLPEEDENHYSSFFEVSYAHFLEKSKKSGEVISSSFIPAPKETEPNHIHATN